MVNDDSLVLHVLQLHLKHRLLYLVNNDPQHIYQKEVLLVLTLYRDNLMYDVVQILIVIHVKSQLLSQHLVLLRGQVGIDVLTQDPVQYIIDIHH